MKLDYAQSEKAIGCNDVKLATAGANIVPQGRYTIFTNDKTLYQTTVIRKGEKTQPAQDSIQASPH